MIPAAFDYERATSIDDVLARLQRAAGAAKLIAGGHSLVPMMKLRLTEPPHLIDIARIPELSGIRQDDGAIEIGAATVHHEVATSPLLRDHCPMLAEAAAEIGDQQVRNRGTLGGSLAHADPAADYPAVVLALDAMIQLRGPRGTRTVAARDFFKDLLTVDLAADELIVSVRLRAGAVGCIQQTPAARLTLCDRRRRGGAGRDGRHSPRSTDWPDRRQHSRTTSDTCRGRTDRPAVIRRDPSRCLGARRFGCR